MAPALGSSPAREAETDRAPGARRRSRVLHRPPGAGELAAGPLLLALASLLWVGTVADTIQRAAATPSLPARAAATVTVVVLTVLTASSMLYLVARQGALHRFREHVPVTRATLDDHFEGSTASVTVLVPSYAEEVNVVRATVWSAALQEFPVVRVALLIDDSPHPADPDAADRLAETRGLADEIEAALVGPRDRHTRALAAFDRRRGRVTADDVLFVALEFEAAAVWMERLARQQVVEDHVDRFFADHVLGGLGQELRVVSDRLFAAAERGRMPSRRRLRLRLVRLTRLFSAHVSTFERKQFVSLSHEANKAMNLNSYIALMGRSWNVVPARAGAALAPAAPGSPGDLAVPEPDYVLTLDADSVLLPGYCARLAHELELPGNERVAVAQTPYSAFPGARSPIERVAGATTDLQHLQHQGKTRFAATFWVGANAVIRREALLDIRRTRDEDGMLVSTYIQDRTVIEDTESTIDLAISGWSLTNYAARLSYSATPSDFGALVVQRRRWANGGLIIMPKLRTLVRERRRRGERTSLAELALRADYLGSIAATSIGVLALQLVLLAPSTATVVSPLGLLAMAPHLIAQALDLRRLGYAARIVVWVGGLNLALVLVNLAGALKSVQQGVTGRKIPFARTPKVKDRTAAPALYVAATYLAGPYLLLVSSVAARTDRWPVALLACAMALVATIAAVAFVPPRTAWQDLRAVRRAGPSSRPGAAVRGAGGRRRTAPRGAWRANASRPPKRAADRVRVRKFCKKPTANRRWACSVAAV